MQLNLVASDRYSFADVILILGLLHCMDMGSMAGTLDVYRFINLYT